LTDEISDIWWAQRPPYDKGFSQRITPQCLNLARLDIVGIKKVDLLKAG